MIEYEHRVPWTKRSAAEFKKAFDEWYSMHSPIDVVQVQIVFDLAEIVYGLKRDLEELKAQR